MESGPELHAKGLELRDRLYGGQLGEQMNNHYRELSPDVEAVAIDWVIGGLMGRPGLDLVKRELVAIASLVGANEPTGVAAHAQGALRVGATPDEVFETIFQCFPYAGLAAVIHALDAVKDILADARAAAAADAADGA